MDIFKPLLVNFWALFFTIDILGTLPVFISLTADYSRPFQQKMALKAPLTAFIILLVFALSGNTVLESFGLSLPAFKIAGGILLLLLSIEMVMAKPEPQMKSTNDNEKEENERRNDISVFPLAIPLLSGPAAITILILLMKEAQGQMMAQFMIIIALFLNMVLCWIAFRYATIIARFLGHSGINVLTRIFGILLTALACQFFIDGIREAFNLI